MTQYVVTVRARHDHAAPDHVYLLDGELSPNHVQRLADELLHDAVTQQATWRMLDDLASSDAEDDQVARIEVAYKPGVTDNEAESVRIGAERLGMGGLRAVKTLRRYQLRAGDNGRSRYNDLVQTALVTQPGQSMDERRRWYAMLLEPPPDSTPIVAHVALLDADDAELQRISQAGVLSLDLAEMRAIQAYFRQEERAPTDGELETLAQTWSEHCSHKTFKAKVRYRVTDGGRKTKDEGTVAQDHYQALQMLDRDCEIDSLIKTFLMRATHQILNSPPFVNRPSSFVLSAFVDNAGILAFGDDHEISFKVETHNHPSALEPFGGANTGVGGVVRDVLGVSAQPIANTDVLCFGPLDMAAEQLTAGVLHPRVVAEGVVAGVRDYGNKLGIPTVNGAVLYDPGYTANPLVFCGTVGLAPRGRHPRNVQPGDAVVVLGGRTGRDGIHGATFSSAELTHTTAQDVGSAVQIGDPITEKKTLDVLLQARDAGLYSAITDCGAGGLSSAVGEMGAETGVMVELEDVPLKYAGLQPWEIWLSEAQERMVLAVPPQNIRQLLQLCADEDVEATVIGRFTGDHRLLVTHRGATVVDLSMDFLHDGMPQRVLEAIWEDRETGRQGDRENVRLQSGRAAPPLLISLSRLLAHPNIASKEPIIRTYDHEVGGRTVAKPLVGMACDGPGDAAVLQPLRTSTEGIALGCGINPRYGAIDPYWMALACVDEAMRNVVAVGGDPARTAILDNFCWGDPRLPDRMAGLVRAAAGCYDAALAYGAPFISGKDSLNNEYRDASGARVAIPPTLLISALAHVPDVRQTVTMDLKEAGNVVFLVGKTWDELGGSHYDERRATNDERSETTHSSFVIGHSSVPKVDLATAPRIMQAIHAAIQQGLVRACHDLSEGGLAVAAAEMAFAGGLGLQLDLRAVPHAGDITDDVVLLFSESPTRFLVEVPPDHADAFAALFKGLPCARVGDVRPDAAFVVVGLDGVEALRAGIDELKAAWQSTTVV
ncbi:MAG TPA: phosphoribosylformylglycinamidine synthase subunit PurL [Roseiflexaceae bacterium]|nr:phosphoribosylformylglycinamidine synthase subunit PurL [Roseiflexaceae bacterium]